MNSQKLILWFHKFRNKLLSYQIIVKINFYKKKTTHRTFYINNNNVHTCWRMNTQRQSGRVAIKIGSK